jgi:hypothetical protein
VQRHFDLILQVHVGSGQQAQQPRQILGQVVPLQLGLPGGRHTQWSAGVLARRQACQTLAAKTVQDPAHLLASAPHQPGDLGDGPSFVRQQDHLTIRALDDTVGLLVALGHRLARPLVQPQPQRGGHQQHSPGLYRAGPALCRIP